MKRKALNTADYFPGVNLFTIVGYDKVRDVLEAAGIHDVELKGDAVTVSDEGSFDVYVAFSKEAVTLGKRFKNDCEEERKVIELAAHEAVHVACAWCEAIGEEQPAEEEFAYMVQAATCCMLETLQKEVGVIGR